MTSKYLATSAYADLAASNADDGSKKRPFLATDNDMEEKHKNYKKRTDLNDYTGLLWNIIDDETPEILCPAIMQVLNKATIKDDGYPDLGEIKENEDPKNVLQRAYRPFPKTTTPNEDGIYPGDYMDTTGYPYRVLTWLTEAVVCILLKTMKSTTKSETQSRLLSAFKAIVSSEYNNTDHKYLENCHEWKYVVKAIQAKCIRNWVWEGMIILDAAGSKNIEKDFILMFQTAYKHVREDKHDEINFYLYINAPLRLEDTAFHFYMKELEKVPPSQLDELRPDYD